MLSTQLIFGLIFFPLLFLGMWWVRTVEKEEWNNGHCRLTGLPWIRYDQDSHGGRMYKDGQGNYCDISYGVDK